MKLFQNYNFNYENKRLTELLELLNRSQFILVNNLYMCKHSIHNIKYVMIIYRDKRHLHKNKRLEIRYKILNRYI